MFHASSNRNKKKKKYLPSILRILFGNVFHAFSIYIVSRNPVYYASMLCVIFARINCTRSRQIRRWTLNNVFETRVCVTLGSHDRSWEMLIAVHTNLKCYAWNCITPIPRTCCYWHYSDYRLTDWLTDLLFFTEVFNRLRFHWRQFQKLRRQFRFWISSNSIFQFMKAWKWWKETMPDFLLYYYLSFDIYFRSNISTKGNWKFRRNIFNILQRNFCFDI